MRNKRDIITGGILAVISVAYIMASFSIKVFEGAGRTVINAGTIPRIWGVCLLILSVILMIRRGSPENAEEDGAAFGKNAAVKAWLYNNYAVAGTLILMAGYIFLMSKIGYLLDTFVYLIIQILLLSPKEEKNWMAAVGISAAVAVGTCYVFTHLLGVPLPAGILTL